MSNVLPHNKQKIHTFQSITLKDADYKMKDFYRLFLYFSYPLPYTSLRSDEGTAH